MSYREDLTQRLRYFNIPVSAYSFDGGMPENCLCVEKIEDSWQVYYSTGTEKRIRGIFYNEYHAQKFLFYLVMKDHVSIKKCWR